MLLNNIKYQNILLECKQRYFKKGKNNIYMRLNTFLIERKI